MASLTYFTVTADWVPSSSLGSLTGVVTFTMLVNSGNALVAPTLTVPGIVVPVTVTGLVTNGVLHGLDGNPVSLVANTAVLNLSTNLFYQVSFESMEYSYPGSSVASQQVTLAGFTFQAPTSGVSVDLSTVAPAAGLVVGQNLTSGGPNMLASNGLGGFQPVDWSIRQTGNHRVPAARTYWANKTSIPSVEDTGQNVFLFTVPGSTSVVSGGLFTLTSAAFNGANYYQFNPSSPVTRAGARFTFGSTIPGTTADGAVGLCLGINEQITSTGVIGSSGFNIPVHFTISPVGWTLGYINGAVGLTTVASGNFNTPLVVGNVVYEAEVFQVGNTVTVVLPDGTVQSFTNSNFAPLGNWGFIEVYTFQTTSNVSGIQEHWWDTGSYANSMPTRQFITSEQVQQVSASRLARPGSNMVYSPNFQNNQAWAALSASNPNAGVPMAAAISTAKSFNGTQSLAVTSTGVYQQFSLLADTYGSAVNVETCAGRVFRFQGQLLAKAGNANAGDVIPYIVALNSSGGFISYGYQGVIVANTLSSSSWTQFVGYGVMPAGTCYMDAGMALFQTTAGDVYYLDAVVVEDATLAYGLGYRG